MELEVGMYVRTKHNGIKKIVALYAEAIFTDTHIRIENKDIIGEPSFSIIELIEEDDFVNEYLVTKIKEDEDGKYLVTITNLIIRENDIETIVTHEQFEAIAYRLGE